MDRKTTGAPRLTTGEKKHNPDYDRGTSSRMAEVLCFLAYHLLTPHTNNDMESTWGNLNPEQDHMRQAYRKVSDAKRALTMYNAKYNPAIKDICYLVPQVYDALLPLMKGGKE